MPLIIISIIFFPAKVFSDIDWVEELFGATNIIAVVGNGGLTAGVSKKGEITTLRWPSPSYFDHINYETSYGKNIREKPFYGARENQGSFDGIIYEKGGKKIITFFRDDRWLQTIKYFSDDSSIILGEFFDKEEGFKILCEWLIPEKPDVLIHRCKLKNMPSEIYNTSFVFYINPAIAVKKTPFNALEQFKEDKNQGFGLLYSETTKSFINFVPLERESLKLNFKSFLSSNPSKKMIDEFLTKIDEKYGNGIYMIVKPNPSPQMFQCGVDKDEVNEANITDALEDLKDGILSNNPASPSNENLSIIIPFLEGIAEIYISFGNTYAEARAGIIIALKTSFEEWLYETKNFWQSFLEDARLPKINDPVIISFCKRTLQTIKISTDRESGAIVASISSQPPYNFDWPRDGSFINYVLDVAGFHDMVTKHNKFYAKVQRKNKGDDAFINKEVPAGSFAMNYYADGMVGGGVIDFEIDQIGLTLWSMWEHTKFLPPAERRDYLSDIFPAIKLGAEALLSCVDEKTKLHCPANEDDNPAFTQTMHGAGTTLLGFKSAVSSSKALGMNKEVYEKWEKRAIELEEAIKNYYFPENPPFTHKEALAWSLWPVMFFSEEEIKNKTPAFEFVKKELIKNLEEKIIKEDPEGSTYDAKATLALAIMLPKDDPAREFLWNVIKKLTREIPTSYTQHFGEVYLPVGDINNDGITEWSHRVSIPHVWEASLNYLSLIAYEDPSIFKMSNEGVIFDGKDGEREEFIEEKVVSSDGCFCKISSSKNFPFIYIFIVSLFISFYFFLYLKNLKFPKR